MKRLLLQIFAWLAILVGAGLMLQPAVSQYLTRRKSTAAVETFVQSAAESAAVAADDPTAENTRPYADLYDALQAYNAEIYAAGQSGLKDPFAYETPAFDLTAYGLPDDMIAALWVPRLDLDLPAHCWGRPRCRWAARTPTRSLPPTAATTARRCCAMCSRYRSATKSPWPRRGRP